MKKIFLFSFFLITSVVSNAQISKSIMLGGVKTPLSSNAINGQIKYEYEDALEVFSGGLFSYAPEFAMEAGNKDAFTVLSAKISGFFIFLKEDTSTGIIEPDNTHFLHVLPVSAGLEAGNTFETINAIAEIGYMPRYSGNDVKNVPFFIKRYTKVGVFLQAGYKYDSALNTTGGKEDQSKEAPEDFIFRAKARFKVDSKSWLRSKKSGVGLGVSGTSDTWYDFVNSKVYYRIEGRLKLFLSQDYSVDFYYQKGSGAPNFNQGDQYGAGLSVHF